MSDLTISEKRAYARAQAAVGDALRSGDQAALTRAQQQLEQLRQDLYEGDPDE